MEIFTRFIYQKVKKEIDGLYDTHEDIKLNIQSKVDLKDIVNSIISKNNCENDLKAHIILKNFEGDII